MAHTFFIMTSVELKRVHLFKELGFGYDHVYNMPVNETVRARCRNVANTCNLTSNCNAKWDNLVHDDDGMLVNESS